MTDVFETIPERKSDQLETVTNWIRFKRQNTFEKFCGACWIGGEEAFNLFRGCGHVHIAIANHAIHAIPTYHIAKLYHRACPCHCHPPSIVNRAGSDVRRGIFYQFQDFSSAPPPSTHCNSDRPHFSHQVSLDSRLCPACRAHFSPHPPTTDCQEIKLNLAPVSVQWQNSLLHVMYGCMGVHNGQNPPLWTLWTQLQVLVTGSFTIGQQCTTIRGATCIYDAVFYIIYIAYVYTL